MNDADTLVSQMIADAERIQSAVAIGLQVQLSQTPADVAPAWSQHLDAVAREMIAAEMRALGERS